MVGSPAGEKECMMRLDDSERLDGIGIAHANGVPD
jgi:hypothetical protein